MVWRYGEGSTHLGYLGAPTKCNHIKIGEYSTQRDKKREFNDPSQIRSRANVHTDYIVWHVFFSLLCNLVCLCGKQNSPLCLDGGRRAPQTGNVWALGRSATKGCMQQATRSAQSINLPMSNLWHSDKQGHRQPGTDRQTYVYMITHMSTHVGNLIGITRTLTVIKGPAHRRGLKGESIEYLRHSENCHGAKTLSAAGAECPSNTRKQELAIVSFI